MSCAVSQRWPIPPHRLIFAAFLMDMYVAMTGLAVQNLGIYVLQAPNVILGLFATLSTVAYTIGCLLSGSISDRHGRRRCMVAACLGVAIAWFILPNLGSWRLVLCVVPFVGAALSLFWPSLQAWLAELTTGGRADLNRNLGWFNILWAIGLMIGPVLSGYLWGAGRALAFYLPALGSLLLVPWLLRTPRGAAQHSDTGAEEFEDHEDADHFLRLAWIGNFASWLCGGIIGAMFPKLGHEVGFSIPLVGWILFAFRAGQVIIFIYTCFRQNWQYRVWPMVAGQLLAAASMCCAAVSHSAAAFAAGFVVVGLCAGMTYVSSLFYALHGRSEGRGKTSGLHEAVLGGGGFVGPLVGGVLAQVLDVRAPFAFGAAALVAACLWQLQRVIARRKAPTEAQGAVA